MMQSPFNFPLELVHMKDQEGNVAPAPAKLAVLQERPSQSRRGGHVVVIGFADGDRVMPIEKLRLEMN